MALKDSLEKQDPDYAQVLIESMVSDGDPDVEVDEDDGKIDVDEVESEENQLINWFSEVWESLHNSNMWKLAWKKRRSRKKLVDRRAIRKTKHKPTGRKNATFKPGFVIPFLNIKLGNKLNWPVIFKWGAVFAFAGLVLMTFVVMGVFAWYTKDLPQPDKIMRKDGFSTKIYDRNEKLLYEVFSEENRTHVTIDQVPQDFLNATIATEDKNFYKHEGFDPLGYVRIVYNAMLKGRVIGGSTLTQQIVKNVLLTSERTVVRKIKELVLAIQIEKKYSKNDILQIYINEVPYGGTSWGVYAAAEMYFQKKPKDLNLIESAILAGMPQSPSYYSPFGAYPEAFKGRTQDVLRRMEEDGYITDLQHREALDDLEKVKFAPQGGAIKAPHFVMYVKKLLEERYGENLVQQGGLSVITSLDLTLHDQVQAIVSEEIEKIEESHKIGNGAVMVMNPNTGEILSMVGSKDYFADDYDGNVNVTTSLRQPGSSIKPLTYLTALREGFTSESVIMDVKTEFPGRSPSQPYVPKNYSGKFVGPVTLRTALGSSLNIPAVKLLAMVGVQDMMQLGYDMGLSTFEPDQENIGRLGLSVTLGGGEVTLLELTSAYSAFANGGKKVEPISVLKVTDRNGNIMEEIKPEAGKQVITKEEAFMVSNMLSDNNARLLTFGPNSLLNIGWRSVAVKTGTTDDQRDNWAIGWDPQVIVGVWVGNNDNSKMAKVASGVSGASPIWRRSILAALEDKPVVEFEMPDGIESITLDKISGWPAHDDFETKEALIIKGTKPTGVDPIHVKMKVCKSDNGKKAPETVIAKGDYDEKEFFVFHEDDPLFGEKDNHWQKGIDEWIAGQEDGRYKPPTEYCDEGDDQVVVRFEEPGDHSRQNNKFKAKVKLAMTGDLNKIEFYAGEDKKGEVNSRPYEYEYDLPDGTYELRVKACNKDNKCGDHRINIGVNKDWDWKPEPTPSPTPTASPTPSASPEASGGASLNVDVLQG